MATANIVIVHTMKKGHDSWAPKFYADSEKRAAAGICDESRTVAYKLDDKKSMAMLYDVDMAKMGPFLAEPERKAIIEEEVESTVLYVAGPKPPTA